MNEMRHWQEHPDRYYISQMLEAVGLPILAEYAKNETNHEILKGYARIIEHKATKTNHEGILSWLFHLGYLSYA